MGWARSFAPTKYIYIYIYIIQLLKIGGFKIIKLQAFFITIKEEAKKNCHFTLEKVKTHLKIQKRRNRKLVSCTMTMSP